MKFYRLKKEHCAPEERAVLYMVTEVRGDQALIAPVNICDEGIKPTEQVMLSQLELHVDLARARACPMCGFLNVHYANTWAPCGGCGCV